jgi:predicted RNA binding protein YcfA (HicA-like mRNA interferase family)
MPYSTLPHELLAFGEGASVLAALKRIGWRHDRTVGSHKIMKKDGWADYPFSFHDSEELGPAILVKISKKTGRRPEDL